MNILFVRIGIILYSGFTELNNILLYIYIYIYVCVCVCVCVCAYSFFFYSMQMVCFLKIVLLLFS